MTERPELSPDRDERRSTPGHLSPLRTAVFVVLFVVLMIALPDFNGLTDRRSLSHVVGVLVGVAVFAVLFFAVKPYQGRDRR